MRPGQRVTPREIVNFGWIWEADSEGHLSNGAVRAAALIQVAQELRSINVKLDSLGVDGLHALIQLATTEHRRREQVRKARLKAARKRRKAKKKPASLPMGVRGNG